MLSIMNEIDPCLLLLLCILYEIQNQIYQQKEVNAQLARLLEIRGMPYHCYINIHKPVLTSDNGEITK